MFLRILPVLIIGGLIWWHLTQPRRVARRLRAISTPLNDWRLIEKVRGFSTALEAPFFEVRLLPMEQINGLALADGTVFISQGLYDRYLAGSIDEDAVVGVVAHEIGHVALGHLQRRLLAMRAETAALGAIFFLMGRIFTGWLGLLVLLGFSALRSRLSHQDEFEADAFGAQLMRRSGLDPRAMIRLLSKLERETGGSAPVSWLSSHPPIRDRIERLETVIAHDQTQAAAG